MKNSGKKESPFNIPPRNYGKRRTRYDLLASWYGDERAQVEIAAHTAQPENIGKLIDSVLLEPSCRNKSSVVAALKSQWNTIVGSFAAFTAPRQYRDGVLTIEVRHSALIAELAPSKDIFMQSINKVVSGEICRDIIFTVGSGR
ncbi:MAG: DUF721 domain-containing protein [Lentisphaeria bacterium]|nr:DUF721 domain-containing protein [Lentisphaeria bacterium]